MTSILNLFSNKENEDITKTKKIGPSPSLNQGKKFKKYQSKIKNNLEKNAEFLSGKEGFSDMGGNSLTTRTNDIINNNNYASQQQTIDNLRQEYQNTLQEYQSLADKISGNLTGYKFAFYDVSGNVYSSSETNVKSQILGDNITSLNGCTGAVGITGTTGEIEVTKNCPNIIIGLPDNVTITGNLTVGGLYFGFIDGGTFE